MPRRKRSAFSVILDLVILITILIVGCVAALNEDYDKAACFFSFGCFLLLADISNRVPRR